MKNHRISGHTENFSFNYYQFSSKMHQEGCGGIVLTKKQRKSPILGIHIKNHTSSHTENLSTNFVHGLGQ